MYCYRSCLRRIARHDDTEFSNQSVINVMEKFVKSVNTMDETILVPCRLMDLKVGDEHDPTHSHHNAKTKSDINVTLNSTDLFNLYNMLKSVKGDLLWGQEQTGSEEYSSPANNTVPQTTNSHLVVKGHVRRPSTVSVASTNSTASSISDNESDVGIENDSGIEEPSQVDDRTLQVAKNFRRHLVGITNSLKQLTEAANYLTDRYQHGIGSSM